MTLERVLEAAKGLCRDGTLGKNHLWIFVLEDLTSKPGMMPAADWLTEDKQLFLLQSIAKRLGAIRVLIVDQVMMDLERDFEPVIRIWDISRDHRPGIVVQPIDHDGNGTPIFTRETRWGFLQSDHDQLNVLDDPRPATEAEQALVDRYVMQLLAQEGRA